MNLDNRMKKLQNSAARRDVPPYVCFPTLEAFEDAKRQAAESGIGLPSTKAYVGVNPDDWPGLLTKVYIDLDIDRV